LTVSLYFLTVPLLPRPNGDNPPKLYSILRDAQKKRKYKFGINVGLLKDLSDALGTDEVLLELSAPDKAILVRPLKDNAGEKGLIMPILIREEVNKMAHDLFINEEPVKRVCFMSEKYRGTSSARDWIILQQQKKQSEAAGLDFTVSLSR
jgi:hypothetical protein